MKKLLLSFVASMMSLAVFAQSTSSGLKIIESGEKDVSVYSIDDEAEYAISVSIPNNITSGSATLRVMTEDDFKAYKQKVYDNADFPGIDFLNPDFYTIVDANNQPIPNGSLTFDVNNLDDRDVSLRVLFNGQKISDWIDYMNSTPEGSYSLSMVRFVVPIGLYSECFPIDDANQAVILWPTISPAVMTVSVEHMQAVITEIPRSKLLNDEDFRAQNIYPEVYLQIPCKNKYGFKVKYSSDNAYIADYNYNHPDAEFLCLKNSTKRGTLYIDGTPAPTENNPSNIVREIEFPAGVTKVRFPIEFVTANIDADDLTNVWTRGFRFVQAKGGKNPICMIWEDSVPDKVKQSLFFPYASEPYENYTFYIGYKVVDEAGINEVVNSDNKAKINDVFDLQGRRVVNPAHGLYIINGKKVIL